MLILTGHWAIEKFFVYCRDDRFFSLMPQLSCLNLSISLL